MTDADRNLARKRIKARREFWSMLAIFIVISLLLTAIWFMTTGGTGYFWPIWPLFGFAIATVFGALNAFGIINREVTEADIDAELERRNRKS
ncbi:2TM domain-containing protein [Lysinimonas soli]|uniref:2TM domain-containing protein n=1 Tax=Lysinimonas soli TaxID=1074233 RepID=A0ABW0NV97_9MICO